VNSEGGRRRRGKLLVGLTGGIASGKTTVAEIFRELGASVVDTDEIARQVVMPGAAGLVAMVNAFGRDILDEAGGLDRARMRARVFADPQARRRLESILHPLIREQMWRQVDASDNPVQVLVIPLLVESALAGLVDRVLVVDCPRQVQLQRLLQRDGETPEQAERILAAQASREARLAAANDIIDNSGSLARLREEAAELYRRYYRHATARAG